MKRQRDGETRELRETDAGTETGKTEMKAEAAAGSQKDGGEVRAEGEGFPTD